MDNRKKRKLTFFTIGLMFLLSGVEYGKIYLFFSLLNVYDENERSLTSTAMVKKRNTGQVLLWHTSGKDSIQTDRTE